MKKSVLHKLIFALAAAVLLTALAASGVLYSANNAVSDALYQTPSSIDEPRIVIIGIDEESLQQLGPYNTWGRGVMAEAIEALNANSKHRPAVIGIDVLYVGESNPEADTALVEAAARYGNVVTACAADFGSELITEGEYFYLDDYYVKFFDKPFTAIANVTKMGHINAMYDADGVMRHSILYIELPDGTLVPSFSRVIYESYAQSQGIEIGDEPATDSRWRWYLPFTGAPGDFSEELSIYDLINGDIPSDYFEDAIVLIGPYAAGLQDSFPTAIERAENMYGVEIHANAIQAMLENNFKYELGNVVQLIALFTVSFVLAFALQQRKVLPSTLIWLAVTVIYACAAKLAYELGVVLNLLWIPLAATVIYIATVAINYVRASKQKREITNTFKRYVAPEIVNEILKEGTDVLGLGGKLTDIAVLFVDIRGFTTMSEALPPETIVEILNKYLTLTSDCVMRNAGTLDKFVGDCTMAIWGAPLPQEDHIFKAVRAAMDMVEGSEALGKELLERFGRTVSFGIGVHCGPAVVGNIGAPMRMDFTAIGDTVNTSARLEANAPPNKIYISRAVADALGNRIKTTSLGDTIKLKGKAEGFEILTLDSITDK